MIGSVVKVTPLLTSGGAGPSCPRNFTASSLAAAISVLIVPDTAEVTTLATEIGTMKAARQMDTIQYFRTVGRSLYAFRLAAVTGLSLAASFPQRRQKIRGGLLIPRRAARDPGFQDVIPDIVFNRDSHLGRVLEQQLCVFKSLSKIGGRILEGPRLRLGHMDSSSFRLLIYTIDAIGAAASLHLEIGRALDGFAGAV